MKFKLSSSFNQLIFIVMIMLVMIMSARLPLDSDLWWHLRAGEWTWQHAQPILNDYFSNSAYGAPWINHSWLSEVIYYLLFKELGFWGVGFLVSLLASVSMIFVYRQMEGHVILKAFLIVLASSVASFVWSPRPQMISLTLMSIVGYILYRFKWHRHKKLWLLPILFALWGNLHGGYPLGLLLIVALVTGESCNLLLGFEGSEILAWQEIIELIGWGILSIFALLINPNGMHILQVPFQTMGVEILQKFIQEWASPDFHDFSQQVFLLMLFIPFFVIGISGKRLDITDAWMLLGFAYMAFIARRNFGPFAIVAAPIIARHLTPAFDQWVDRIKTKSSLTRFWTHHLSTELTAASKPFPRRLQLVLNMTLIFLLGLAFVVKLTWVSDREMITKAIEDSEPTKAISWMLENKPQGRILNEYNTGGYFIWSLRDYPVFVDGRTDMYGDALLKDWLTLVQADQGWQALILKYQIEIVILNPDRPLVEKLQNIGWRKSYEDKQAVILLATH